eukprot:4426617-Pyramimonas_sp.AAC.1
MVGLHTVWGPRTVTFQHAISEVFHVNETVLAGCSLAVALAKVLLYDLLASLARSCPVVMIRNVVGDVHVQVVGTQRFVADQRGRAGRALA